MDSVEDELVKKVDGESSNKHFENLENLLKNRFLKFKQKKSLRASYQHFSLCAECDDPCNYTLENNRLNDTDKVVTLGKKFISTLVAGKSETLPSQLKEIRSNVDTTLGSRYNRSPQRGEIYCAYIHLTKLLKAWLSQRYRQIALPVLFEFEKMMVDILWKNDLGEIHAVDALISDIRNLLISDMMKKPRKEMPGCKACRIPCRFGHIFQRDNNSAVITLCRVIEEQKKKGNKPTYSSNGVLTRQVQNYLQFELMPELKNDAAYCWLANSTYDPSPISGFWKQQTN